MEETAAPAPTPSSPRRQLRPQRSKAPVLTIHGRDDVETAEDRDDVIWHEIHNAYRTRKIITGKLGRSPSGQEYADLMLRQNKILGNMLGADIDFIVRGIDSKTRSVAVSCREAMRRSSLEDLGIKADIKSISENTDRDNLQKCRIQGKYAGRVTDVHKGIVYVRLSNGVNAAAHSCYDYRMPGKKDDVSFAVTRLDMERGVAVGIIPRIIRQNL